MRSQGILRLGFSRRREATVLADSFQSGCLRARVPRGYGDRHPCAVILNTSGGLADGDRLEQRLRWDADTSATVTSQAAEKVYRAMTAGCHVLTEIEVETGAHAEWLPQETILFDGARLRREARIILADGASFLGLEAVVLGRTAMGEVVRRSHFSDRLRVWRGGRLVYADALELSGDIDGLMARAAIGGGARGLAVVVHASPGAAELIGPVREALGCALGRTAASHWNGLLAVRLLAPDGAALRHDIELALSALRQGRPLPRVWTC